MSVRGNEGAVLTGGGTAASGDVAEQMAHAGVGCGLTANQEVFSV